MGEDHELLEINDWLLRYKVIGTPLPVAKKQINRITKSVYARDWRVRAGKRVDIGLKAAWITKVQLETMIVMKRAGRKPFPDNHPILVGFFAILPRSKSAAGREHHVSTPDLSNICYGVENCLKADSWRVNKKTGVKQPPKYPDGILYHDDKQIIGVALPYGKRYVKNGEKPGLVITVIDFEKCPKNIPEAEHMKGKL